MMKAFIYSLDAFISLMIMAMALNMLVFGLGASTYQYAVAYQLKLLSSDGIKAISASTLPLDRIISGSGREDACKSIIRDNLPPGYGYEIQVFDSKTGQWKHLCGEGDKSTAGIGVQSSDAIVTVSTHTSIAGMSPSRGSLNPYDPYDYITCNGGEGVPCNLHNYTLNWGLETTALRLVVFV